MNAIKTTHNLDFLAAPYKQGLAAVLFSMTDPNPVTAFKIGTCEGIYNVTRSSYCIIAIQNDVPGNGHFEDVLEWFEFAAKRDKKNLTFKEILNEKFGKHLVEKRGFKSMGNDCVKKFTGSLANVY